ncbi:MAG TPA: hypothetical protein VMW16_13930 [Sedimentisphaerales bacterium]|nr:hypothetical protein [Sedimentisphaerales bacterium]
MAVLGRSRKYDGFLIIEIAAALAILGTLMIGLALSLDGFARFNGYVLARQRCTAAAAAELDSLSVTGGPIREEDFKRLWPGLSVLIEESAGTGQWEGTRLVKVTTVGRSYRRQVKVELNRYIQAEGRQ